MAQEIKKSNKRNLDALNNAPKSHLELCRLAKKQLKKMPKAKYKMKVFLRSGRKYCTLEASTISKLENSRTTFSEAHKDYLFDYGEIKPIKIK